MENSCPNSCIRIDVNDTTSVPFPIIQVCPSIKILPSSSLSIIQGNCTGEIANGIFLFISIYKQLVKVTIAASASGPSIQFAP